jgi:hypothetical protein
MHYCVTILGDDDDLWAEGAAIRAKSGSNLLYKRILVKNRGEGVVTDFQKSFGFGWPSLHTILFDDGEEETMVLWNGGNNNGAKFRLLSKSNETVIDPRRTPWQYAARVCKDKPHTLEGQDIFVKTRGAGKITK